ncbi:hypothetical protein [Cupriavidus sp. UME77]|uniref:hypothetical protein n=1 Tax=Cupriavidus sp. UME77 TaxID=1862321 RepID=UPI0015FFCFD2|nr:hypothetical protein [Cupriavidus sp. UME77]
MKTPDSGTSKILVVIKASSLYIVNKLGSGDRRETPPTSRRSHTFVFKVFKNNRLTVKWGCSLVVQHTKITATNSPN